MNLGYNTSFVPTFIPLSASTTSYTASDLIAGASYNFKITAYNLLYTQNTEFDDLLNFSDVATFIIANVPGQITIFSQST